MGQALSHGDIIPNLASFNRHLRAENLSPKTQEPYSKSVNQLVAYSKSQGVPLDVASIHWEHIESFIAHLLAIKKPATANNRYRWLQSFSNGWWRKGKSRLTL